MQKINLFNGIASLSQIHIGTGAQHSTAQLIFLAAQVTALFSFIFTGSKTVLILAAWGLVSAAVVSALAAAISAVAKTKSVVALFSWAVAKIISALAEASSARAEIKSAVAETYPFHFLTLK